MRLSVWKKNASLGIIIYKFMTCKKSSRGRRIITISLNSAHCFNISALGLHQKIEIQLTLAISNSLISNNRLFRSENLVPD